MYDIKIKWMIYIIFIEIDLAPFERQQNYTLTTNLILMFAIASKKYYSH